MDEVFGIFPTPVMRAPGTLDQSLVARLVEHFTALTTKDNSSSPNLSHTEMLRRPALYMVGAVAAYWSWLRIAAIVF